MLPWTPFSLEKTGRLHGALVAADVTTLRLTLGVRQVRKASF
ncbi:hypothetical protein N182_25090 [Sinorhizobium sp. GL2]|nr:hypothetical protein N182_25090 [Sinorhizobium sp. GL2]